MKKFLSMLMGLALTAGMLAGCGEAAEEAVPAAVTVSPSPVPEITASEPAEPDFALAYGKYAPDTVVLSVDGYDMDWETFFNAFQERANFFWLYYGISDYSMEMDEMGETVGDWILEQAEIDLRSMALFHNWAEELGVTLTEEDHAAIDQEIQDYADRYYDGDMAAMFGDLAVSEAYTRAKGEYARLNDRLFAHYFGEDGALLSDEDTLAYAADNEYLYAKRILLKTLTDEGDPLSEDAVAAKLSSAEDILSRLQACAPEVLPELFDAMMETYSEDPNLDRFPDGFYFKEGEIAAMSDTVKSMEVGELSGIVECDYGYQIIYRPPMSPDHIFDSDDTGPYTLRRWAASMLFGNMANERYEAQTVTYAPEFADFDIAALFEN